MVAACFLFHYFSGPLPYFQHHITINNVLLYKIFPSFSFCLLLILFSLCFCFSDGFKGDLYLVIKFLLPGVMKTVYNLNNKQLVKLFSQVSQECHYLELFPFYLFFISQGWRDVL